MSTKRIVWRWAERDLGFRFQQGKGKQAADYYQAIQAGEFYHVPGSQRKLDKTQLETLAKQAKVPTAPTVVVNPWNNYADKDFQVITALNHELCLNWEKALFHDSATQWSVRCLAQVLLFAGILPRI